MYYCNKDLKETIENPELTPLDEWLKLHEIIRTPKFKSLLENSSSIISASSLYEKIHFEMANHNTLSNRAEMLSGQISQASRDPRFDSLSLNNPNSISFTAKTKWFNQIEPFVNKNREFFKKITTNLRLLDDAKKDPFWKEAESRMVAASISLTRNNGQVIAEVEFPENPFVAYTRIQRKYLENSLEGKNWVGFEEMNKFRNGETNSLDASLMRFSAGGSLVILKVLKETTHRNKRNYTENDYEKLIVVSQKENSEEIIHSNYLRATSGVAEDEKDWLNPFRIVAGECVEEIRLRADDLWFVPFFTGEDYADTLNDRVSKTLELHRRHLLTYRIFL
jgi:hypothetical protein